jgi:hypothetical protein
MASSRMLRRLGLVRTGVPEELSASFIRVTRIGELGTTLALFSSLAPRRLLVNVCVRGWVKPWLILRWKYKEKCEIL